MPSVLPTAADYSHARERLDLLRRPTREAAAVAWFLLLSWRDSLHAEGFSLPVPRVYSNETGAVELEWEVGPRHLVVTCGRVVGYTRWDVVGFEDEGRAENGVVLDLLRWLVGGVPCS